MMEHFQIFLLMTHQNLFQKLFMQKMVLLLKMKKKIFKLYNGQVINKDKKKNKCI